MARVRFTEDFDFRPNSETLIAYHKGMEATVVRRCADQAKAAGKAVEIRNHSRAKSDGKDT